ncbi:membrane protein [Companilactobacillus sp. RD055328]|uniref:DedA family protein n=1 Tax=Companilactobacillus sp. RD055328 TaxID=2916634 RepID=UPI001FC8D4D8|nr:DedA family protein [Companilactobacillus sp. RD055328]GKQ42080.1 membrane protein [Companilactobacillus sp. RD055328]
MQLIDFILHVDEHLASMVGDFGVWTYVILFAIVFVETGLVIFPFLPGDSLIFAAAALAANEHAKLNVWLLLLTFFTAAVIGDSVNYEIGEHLSEYATKQSFLKKFINQEHLDAAHKFFEKHGGKTIAIGRFIPFIRTFVPFVAGSGSMHYRRFLIYNVFGATLWVGIFTVCGYWFGNIPTVQEHFSLIVIGIIIVSVLPAAIAALNSRKKKS